MEKLKDVGKHTKEEELTSEDTTKMGPLKGNAGNGVSGKVNAEAKASQRSKKQQQSRIMLCRAERKKRMKQMCLLPQLHNAGKRRLLEEELDALPVGHCLRVEGLGWLKCECLDGLRADCNPCSLCSLNPLYEVWCLKSHFCLSPDRKDRHSVKFVSMSDSDGESLAKEQALFNMLQRRKTAEKCPQRDGDTKTRTRKGNF